MGIPRRDDMERIHVAFIATIIACLMAFPLHAVEYRNWEFTGGYVLQVPADWPDINDLEAYLTMVAPGVASFECVYTGTIPNEAKEVWYLIFYMDKDAPYAFGGAYYNRDHGLMTYYLCANGKLICSPREEFQAALKDFLETGKLPFSPS